MRKTQRLAAVGALAALTLSIAACSNSEEAASPTTTADAATTSAAAPSSSSSSSSSSKSASPSSSSGAAAGSGVTTVKDIFGPSCSAVPKTGAGSPEDMVDAPVGTAASTNPLFTTLTAGVKAAGLLDTLNKPDATYTVFGPTDDAFKALPPGTLDTLLKDPKGDLATILTYHVLPKRYDAAGLVKAGTAKSVQGEEVTITGTADAPLINGNPVACGNIPTANATVFAIGKVLTVPSMK